MTNNSKLVFFTNNNGTTELTQTEFDGAVTIHTFHGAYDFAETKNDLIIPAGDMVMLINYYRYVKENNIHCGFINPTGTNEM